MTREKWTKLSDEEKRIMVDRCSGVAYGGLLDDSNNPDWRCLKGSRVQRRPNYLNDLDAMHKIEMGLNGEQYTEYCRNVERIIVSERGFGWSDHSLSASSKTRAEAFVLTVDEEK